MAKALGLTAGAIEALRAEQDALMVTMMLEFNRGRPGYKQELMQDQLAANFGVTGRTIRRWREWIIRRWRGQADS